MLNEKQLRDLLHSSETHWVERKTSYNPGEIKKAIVAFANSLPEGQCGVLFVGARPDGGTVPVPNADKRQRDIRSLAQEQCFPPIVCNPAIIRENGNEIIGVVVGFSPNRPHFAGHAFVRAGSQTRKASQEVFDDLVASRSDKIRRLLREKGNTVTVRRHYRVTMYGPGYVFAGKAPQTFTDIETLECRVDHCDTFILRCTETSSNKQAVFRIQDVEIDFDVVKQRTCLVIGRLGSGV